MGSREERLTAEIERTKQELAQHLSELRVEASAAQRRAMRIAAIAVGAYVAYRLVTFAWGRGRR